MQHYLIATHLLIAIVTILFINHATAEPSPAPAPALVSLPSRPSRLPAYHQQAPEVEHDLLPFVLISTVDGALHAVERDGGKIKWTLRDGVSPLVGGEIRGKGLGEDYIVEPLSGGLYTFDEEDEGETKKIRRLPLSVEQLIELSPFTFPHSPSRIFTGSKHTSLLTLDLRTGQQLDCFSSFASNLSTPQDCTCDTTDDLLDDLEGQSRSNRDILFVGRTDYRLSIHSPGVQGPASDATGVSRRGGVQEIVYSTYTPNSFDKPLAEFWAKAGAAGDMREEDGTLSKKTRVELRHDGVAVGVEAGRGPKWTRALGNIGIAVYDILLPLSPITANPILVPQPPIQFSTLFPLSKNSQKIHYDLLAKPPSTYIADLDIPLAITGNDDSLRTTDDEQPPRRLLFVLSSASYPYINFAPIPKPGAISNGSFQLSEEQPEKDQLLPYLLDPPPEAPSLGINDSEPEALREIIVKPVPNRGWAWWVVGALSSLALCFAAVIKLSRRPEIKQTESPGEFIDEKTPLLLIPEGLRINEKVTLDEHEHPPQASTSSAVITPLTDPPAKKKSNRRRVRGKKKPRNGDSAQDDEEGDEEDKGEGPSTSPQNSVGREKPLPELPREISTVALADAHDVERLAISDVVIGYGSHGTVVLKGTWGGRPVAVKRLLSDFTRLASQEVKLLQASDDHSNVIRYYCQEKRDNFLYIALDLCQASLADLIESPDKHLELASALDRKKALMQITAGLKHLHGLKIIHRDIKPQNVLVSQAKDHSLRMLVSDFGLARRLDQDQSSFAPTANNLAGSLGWRAPECIRGQVRLTEYFDRASSCSSSSTTSSSTSLLDLVESDKDRGRSREARLTKAVDLFALGCLYFWVLMGGEHPFGEVYDRESNIVKGEIVNLGMLDVLGEEGWEAKDLIGRLLSMSQDARPETTDCLTHPFFWTLAKRLAFLCDASDRFEIMELEPPEATLVMLEANAVEVVGKDWYTRLDKVFISNLGKYRKYKGNSVRDLLRALRNKKHHYQDLEPSVKRHLGTLPAGFLHYFTSRYPGLFLHVYGVVRDSRLRHESMFEGYFQEG